MKTKVFLFLLVCNFIISKVYANDDVIYKESGVFTTGLLLSKCDINGTPDSPLKTESALRGWLFSIENITSSGDYIIKFNDFFDGNLIKSASVYANKINGNLFLIPSASVGTSIMKIESKKIPLLKEPRVKFDFGATLVPLKLRINARFKEDSLNNIRSGDSSNFDFTSNFNIGTTFGLKIRMNERGTAYTSLLAGISYTAIAVDEKESQGKLKEKTTLSAITPSINLVFAYKDFSTGITVGWDIMPNSIGSYWIYNKKTWIGVGIGYTIKDTKGKDDQNPK